MIELISQNFTDPSSKDFYPLARYTYHSDDLRHSTEDFQTLKSEVKKFQAKMIVVQIDNPPNVT